MNKAVFLAAALAGVSTAASAQTATAEADVRLGKVSNQYICTFDNSVSPANVRAETARAVGSSMGQVLFTYKTAIRGFAVRMPATTAGSPVAELRRNNPKIAACEQDQVVKALVRPPWEREGGDEPAGEEEPWGITRVGGPGATSSNKAWVIDSGIDLDHPDLNVDKTGLNASFVRGDPNDQNGHGTHVAGTIAAIDNEEGVIGVSPGTVVVSVRVLDRRGSGTWSGVIAGVEHVAANGSPGDVANMSLGGGFSQSVNDAVVAAASKGIHFTLAAGNDGADASNYSPASAQGAFVYTVSASDSADKLASFSNYGNPPVDWAEPGVGVNSTYKDGGYRSLSGTSMAAPHLAGILVQGSVNQCGNVTANSDPDGNPDKIGCHP